MKGQFDEYPPEFDLSAPDLQRYGITKIWAAHHNPELRPAVYREWRTGYRSFPAWVNQQIYAQRRAKHTPSRRNGGSTHRPPWRAAYAAELAASPKLAAALSAEPNRRLGEVFRLAGLSGQETVIFRRLCEGAEPGEIAKELKVSWGNYQNARKRALAKLENTFVVVPRFIDREALAPGAA